MIDFLLLSYPLPPNGAFTGILGKRYTTSLIVAQARSLGSGFIPSFSSLPTSHLSHLSVNLSKSLSYRIYFFHPHCQGRGSESWIPLQIWSKLRVLFSGKGACKHHLFYKSVSRFCRAQWGPPLPRCPVSKDKNLWLKASLFVTWITLMSAMIWMFVSPKCICWHPNPPKYVLSTGGD